MPRLHGYLRFQAVQKVQIVPVRATIFELSATKMNDDSFKDFVLDQLQDLDDIDARRMFGGYGLYQDEFFFGIIFKGRLYFKTDETTISDYKRGKMKPFRPNARQTLKSYYQVPVEILEDKDQLGQWAEKAIRCRKKKD